MKRARSFSLLTFLMAATIIAIGFALYQSNNELAEKEVLFRQRATQSGLIDAEPDSQLHFRRLNGYPPMSFGFRYQLPKGHDYTLKVGSGIQTTDFPAVVAEHDLGAGQAQGTLVVNLFRFPDAVNKAWIVECVSDESAQRTVCEETKFEWLEAQRVAPTIPFNGRAVERMRGHGPVETAHVDHKAVVLLLEREFDSDPLGMHRRYDDVQEEQEFAIWLERMDPGESSSINEPAQQTKP